MADARTPAAPYQVNSFQNDTLLGEKSGKQDLHVQLLALWRMVQVQPSTGFKLIT